MVRRGQPVPPHSRSPLASHREQALGEVTLLRCPVSTGPHIYVLFAAGKEVPRHHHIRLGPLKEISVSTCAIELFYDGFLLERDISFGGILLFHYPSGTIVLRSEVSTRANAVMTLTGARGFPGPFIYLFLAGGQLDHP